MRGSARHTEKRNSIEGRLCQGKAGLFLCFKERVGCFPKKQVVTLFRLRHKLYYKALKGCFINLKKRRLSLCVEITTAGG